MKALWQRRGAFASPSVETDGWVAQNPHGGFNQRATASFGQNRHRLKADDCIPETRIAGLKLRAVEFHSMADSDQGDIL